MDGLEHQEEMNQNIVLDYPVHPNLPSTRLPNYNLVLPIPSPDIYQDNYHHPGFPDVLSPINCYADPINRPYDFPQPMGLLTANNYNILGATLHDFGYANYHPEKLFTKWTLWYLEVNDDLFRKICPSDLNDMPCEWDELQGGCQMLRLCEAKHKYIHPHLGQIPACKPELQHQCRYVHDIEPSCRSIGKQLRLPVEEQFKGTQMCRRVARDEFCEFGHDFESARADAVYRYWEHKEEARVRGSIGFVARDVEGKKLMRVPRPAYHE